MPVSRTLAPLTASAVAMPRPTPRWCQSELHQSPQHTCPGTGDDAGLRLSIDNAFANSTDTHLALHIEEVRYLPGL